MKALEPMAVDLPDAVAAPVIQPKPVPPKPAVQPAAAPAPQKKQLDTSSIQVGSILRHKAFGVGEVTAMEGKYILVAFQDAEKRFLFPGAVLQGFLSIETD